MFINWSRDVALRTLEFSRSLECSMNILYLFLTVAQPLDLIDTLRKHMNAYASTQLDFMHCISKCVRTQFITQVHVAFSVLKGTI